MYTASMSGRSSRSTLMLTKSWLIIAAVAGSSKDSCAMTWHQWQAAYPIEKDGNLPLRCLGKRRWPPLLPVDGVVGVLLQVRRRAVLQAVGHRLILPGRTTPLAGAMMAEPAALSVPTLGPSLDQGLRGGCRRSRSVQVAGGAKQERPRRGMGAGLGVRCRLTIPPIGMWVGRSVVSGAVAWRIRRGSAQLAADRVRQPVAGAIGGTRPSEAMAAAARGSRTALRSPKRPQCHLVTPLKPPRHHRDRAAESETRARDHLRRSPRSCTSSPAT